MCKTDYPAEKLSGSIFAIETIPTALSGDALIASLPERCLRHEQFSGSSICSLEI